MSEARIGMTATALTESNFDSFVKKSDKVLIDFYDDAHRNDKELEAALRIVRDFGSGIPFGKIDATAESSLAQRFVPEGHLPQLMWFLHGEATQYHRTLRDSKSISDFVLALDRDPVIEVSNEEEASAYSRTVFAQVRRRSEWYKVLEVVAAKHMDTVGFTMIESGKDNITWILNGTDAATYTGKANVDELDKWVRSLLVKSEPIPEQQDGDSIIVVGSSFEDMVIRPDKDVFLMVYAPWCGFSRKFFKTWETFARQAVSVSHLVVAKIDGDANTSPLQEFQWNAFPALLFVKAGEHKPVVFKGNRTIENLVKFANEHGSRKFELTETPIESGEALSEL